MHKIKQAIIPVAGHATRIYPMNKVTKKALLPIIDSDGRVKPVIMKLLEELDEAGIENIYLIIGKYDKPLYDNLFARTSINIFNKLSNEDKEYEEKLNKIGKKISYIVQEDQLGFGAAVYLAKPMLNDEPAILLLGDTIYKSYEENSAVEQLLSYHDEIGTTIIALKELNENELKYYGVSLGKWEDDAKHKMHIDRIVEKPSVEYAKRNLLINNKFFGNFGEFVLTRDVFDEFRIIMDKPIEKDKEYQLMDAFDNLARKGNVHGLVINGNSYDIGNTESYIKVLRKTHM